METKLIQILVQDPNGEKPKRNTCRALVGLLRATLRECPEELEAMGATISMTSAVLRQTA